MFRQTFLGLFREEIVIRQNQISWFYFYLFYCTYFQINTSETVINFKTYHVCLSRSNLSSFTNLDIRPDMIIKAGWFITKFNKAYFSICSVQCFVVYTIVISNTSFSIAVFTFCTFVPRYAVRRFIVSSSYLRSNLVWRKISIITFIGVIYWRSCIFTSYMNINGR